MSCKGPHVGFGSGSAMSGTKAYVHGSRALATKALPLFASFLSFFFFEGFESNKCYREEDVFCSIKEIILSSKT